MPTHTTITENLDGTFNVQVHDADALRRIQTMCDIIREDDDDDGIDAERALTAAYADDLYNVIGEALSADYKANGWRPGADRWDALTAWLCRNPASRSLPWEYMGHDEKGAAHYRERQHGNRLTLTPSGRLARIHTTTTIGQCPNCEPHHAPCTHCAALAPPSPAPPGPVAQPLATGPFHAPNTHHHRNPYSGATVGGSARRWSRRDPGA
jgi:hypothetical protein